MIESDNQLILLGYFRAWIIYSFLAHLFICIYNQVNIRINKTAKWTASKEMTYLNTLLKV